MHPETGELIRRLHEAAIRAVLAFTGGGASAGAWLLSVPGASRTILEVAVPYAQAALDDFLGHSPASYCSAETAADLSRRARSRARWLAPDSPTVGVGCTASLRSDRPKKGLHRVHVAASTAAATRTYSLTLAKEQRERQGEEEVAGRLVLNALAWAFGIGDRLDLPLLADERVEEKEDLVCGSLAALLRGEVVKVCTDGDGRHRTDAPAPTLLVPGSFNPLHEGHRGIAAVAARRLQLTPAYEVSVVNVEKPPLAEPDVRARLAQFAGSEPVWLTRAPTFVEKARLFGNVTFAVGVDTAARVIQPRFYGGSEEAMRHALTELRQRGCRFLVAGRRDGDQFVELGHLAIPAEFADLFAGVPESEFRADVSSTALRAT